MCNGVQQGKALVVLIGGSYCQADNQAGCHFSYQGYGLG